MKNEGKRMEVARMVGELCPVKIARNPIRRLWLTITHQNTHTHCQIHEQVCLRIKINK